MIMDLKTKLILLIKIFLKEMDEYVDVSTKEFFNDSKNFDNIIEYTDGIGAWCNFEKRKIYLGKDTQKMIDAYFKSDKEYNSNPNVKMLDNSDNSKDYLDYFNYMIVGGKN
ncbi:MAG: hypothetical protein IJO32_04400 [Bacilli bacterium]|nr:hypothetical protein [Bacilli bacterium]